MYLISDIHHNTTSLCWLKCNHCFFKPVSLMHILIKTLCLPLLLLSLNIQAYEDKYSTAGWWEVRTYNASVTVNRNERLVARYAGPHFKSNPNSWVFWVITPEIRNTPTGAKFTIGFSFDGGKKHTYDAGIIHTGNGVLDTSNNTRERLQGLADLMQSHDEVTVYVNTMADVYSTTKSSSGGRQIIRSGTVTEEKPYTFSLKGSKRAMDQAKACAMAMTPENRDDRSGTPCVQTPIL